MRGSARRSSCSPDSDPKTGVAMKYGRETGRRQWPGWAQAPSQGWKTTPGHAGDAVARACRRTGGPASSSNRSLTGWSARGRGEGLRSGPAGFRVAAATGILRRRSFQCRSDQAPGLVRIEYIFASTSGKAYRCPCKPYSEWRAQALRARLWPIRLRDRRRICHRARFRGKSR